MIAQDMNTDYQLTFLGLGFLDAEAENIGK